jgi:hypothetical protein
MSSESSTGSLASHRNKTVAVAFWVLGAVAVIELAFAAIALAPRIAAGMKSSQQPPPGTAQGVPGDSSNPMAGQQSGAFPPSLSPRTQNPVNPSTPVQNVISEATDRPFRQPPSDASLPQGASLQILNARLQGRDDGARTLQIAIKCRPGESIDVPQVKVQVYFYDEENGEIVPSKAQVTSKWLSAPVDWKDGEPELLEVSYNPDTVDPDIHFAGYVVAVYYKGDRQDCRANPVKLEKLFEPKYFIGLDDQ